jgi:hypothetical protein
MTNALELLKSLVPVAPDSRRRKGQILATSRRREAAVTRRCSTCGEGGHHAPAASRWSANASTKSPRVRARRPSA